MIRRRIEFVVVEPFPPLLLPLLWNWHDAYRHRTADDFSPKDQYEFVAAHMRRMEAGGRSFEIRATDPESTVGYVAIEALNAAGVYQMHSLFAPEFNGKGNVAEAMKQVLARAFAAEGVRKLVADLFVDNYGRLTTLKAVGFREAGRLRQHTYRGGEVMDVRVVELLKEDLSDVRI